MNQLEKILQEFDEIPLLESEYEEESDLSYLAGQAHFKQRIRSFLKGKITDIVQECYLQCLAVECGEGQCAEAIVETFPFISRYQDTDE